MSETTIHPKKNLFTALSKAQGDFPVIKKNASANAGKFEYNYVTLDAIIEAIKAPMTKNGLGFFQEIRLEPAQGVLTTVFHNSGESLEIFCPIVGSYNTMQQMGSSITYARRYGLQTAVGVFAEEDDDGAKATEHNKKNPAPKPASRPSQGQNNYTGTKTYPISEKQIKRFWALSNAAGVQKIEIESYLHAQKIESIKDLSRKQYDAICDRFQSKIDSAPTKEPVRKEHKKANDNKFTIPVEEPPTPQEEPMKDYSEGFTTEDIPFNDPS